MIDEILEHIERIRSAAHATLKTHKELGLEGAPMMTITLRKRPPGFPHTELLCEHHDGTRVYHVCPHKVLAWCAKTEKRLREEV